MSTNIAHLLISTASWSRPVRTGRKGQWTETMEVQDAAVPCRIAPAGAKDFQIAKQMGLTVSFVGYFDAAFDGRQNDLITVDGRDYLIRGRFPPSKGNYHLKVGLEERQRGRSADVDSVSS